MVATVSRKRTILGQSASKTGGLFHKNPQMVQINEMRGVAALLVVLFHAVGSEPELATSFLGELIQRFAFVRMPLFIAISGYLYGVQRGTRPLTFASWYKRSRRIVPPFLLVTIVCWIISAKGGVPFSLITGIVFGAWHLWYLQALVVILLAVAVLETVVRPKNWHLLFWTIGAFLISASGIFSEVTWLSVHKAVYLLPYFFAGAAFGAMPQLFKDWQNRYVIYVLGIIAIAMHEVLLAGVVAPWANVPVIAGVMGVASFLTLAFHMPANNTFRCVGAHSLPIFLWHLPLSALTSFLLLNPLSVDGHVSAFTKIVVGTTLPIAMSMMVARVAPGMVIFVGKRAISHLPAVPSPLISVVHVTVPARLYP